MIPPSSLDIFYPRTPAAVLEQIQQDRKDEMESRRAFEEEQRRRKAEKIREGTRERITAASSADRKTTLEERAIDATTVESSRECSADWRATVEIHRQDITNTPTANNPVSPQLQAPILNQFNNLFKHELTFTDIPSFINLAGTCKLLNNSFKNLLSDFKKSAALMDMVLNITEANKKKIREIIQSNPEYILIRTFGYVKYLSSKQQRIVKRISLDTLSPLEAAAYSGDFYLVNMLSAALPDHLQGEAGLQLQTILSRRSFLSEFNHLKKAYDQYLIECLYLKDVRIFDESGKKITDTKEYEESWVQIAVAQKKISTFGLQKLCQRGSHKLLDNLREAPTREVCFYHYLLSDKLTHQWMVMDLDLIGPQREENRDTILLQIKSTVCDSIGDGWFAEQAWMYGPMVQDDANFVNALCNVISEELHKTKALLLSKAALNTVQKPKAEQSSSSEPLVSDKAKESVRASVN